MKIPAFTRTIRFRLTVFYALFFFLLVIVLVSGINVAVGINSDFRTEGPPSQADFATWIQTHQADFGRMLDMFRLYSVVGVLAIIIIGAVGIYSISGRMLRPVDKVSSLAGRISYTNLKERINYKGPDDEIKRLADTLDDMLSRLETAVDSQKQFIQDASHELRTPISTTITNIEVLEMNDQATVADYQKLLTILKFSLERMSNISNSLLLLSEDQQYVSAGLKTSIIPLVSEVVIELSGEAAKSKVTLNWQPPEGEIICHGDAFHLKQAIVNLVSNAIKYNRPGGSVQISVFIEGSNSIIHIADTGIGIAPENLARLFTRFFRVDKSRSRGSGGSGLGLSIVKKIIEDHGGKVYVESTIGQGSSFYISLPLTDLSQ